MQGGAGVYSILKSVDDGKYILLYVGETNSFAERIGKNHQRFGCWTARGATHHALYYLERSTQTERKAIERSLITKYDPACNLQYA